MDKASSALRVTVGALISTMLIACNSKPNINPDQASKPIAAKQQEKPYTKERDLIVRFQLLDKRCMGSSISISITKDLFLSGLWHGKTTAPLTCSDVILPADTDVYGHYLAYQYRRDFKNIVFGMDVVFHFQPGQIVRPDGQEVELLSFRTGEGRGFVPGSPQNPRRVPKYSANGLMAILDKKPPLLLADLGHINLDNRDIENTSLAGANMNRSSLRNTNASLVNFKFTTLTFSDLREANLEEADFRWAKLRNADARKANLKRSILRKADLQGVDFRGSDLRGADLRGSKTTNAKFDGALISEETLIDLPDHYRVIEGTARLKKAQD